MSGPDEPIDAEIVPDPAPGAPTPVTPAILTPAAPQPPPTPDYDEHGVPSLDYVRDKIEGRFATSVGMGELAAETAQGRSLEEQEAEREKAAKAKLEEIRRSMGG